MPNLDALKEELLQSSEEFQHLHSEHQDCERRLQAIHQKTFLSQEDEVQEKRIKIHKLKLKDRMEELLRAFRDSHVSA